MGAGSQRAKIAGWRAKNIRMEDVAGDWMLKNVKMEGKLTSDWALKHIRDIMSGILPLISVSEFLLIN